MLGLNYYVCSQKVYWIAIICSIIVLIVGAAVYRYRVKKIKQANFGNISFQPPIKKAIEADREATIAG